MKAVEVLRKQDVLHKQTDGQSSGLGIWLPLETIWEIPLSEPSQLVLWRYLLTQLDNGKADGDGNSDVRAALLASLCGLEPLVACQHLEHGGWEDAESDWAAALIWPGCAGWPWAAWHWMRR